MRWGGVPCNTHCPLQQDVDDDVECRHGPGLDNVAMLMGDGGGTPRGVNQEPLWKVALVRWCGNTSSACLLAPPPHPPQQPQSEMLGFKDWTPEKDQKMKETERLSMRGMWWQWWQIYTTNGGAGAAQHTDLTPEIAVEWPADEEDRHPPQNWRWEGEESARMELARVDDVIDHYAGMRAGT